ncbi:platelet glycoprotein Ib alpha chain-like isoform X2 [Rhopalosiphum padi]|uniref:platelet glycoprotein Ib alpha chain-like isoform X2 n=1 Tax=Rhopalosiphum padi TaxID=40932 RepID=UPI00298DA23A|nr:platelet glycoprotein Ib alpha chain-like isoform X2 [Rhopalosiphum padi]
MKWSKVISTACALVFVSLSYLTECSGAPPTAPSRSSAHNSTKPVSSKCAPLVRCTTSKPKVFPGTAIAAALTDLLKTAANEHQNRPTTLHQFPDVLRTFVRFIGIVVSPPSSTPTPPTPPTPPTSTAPSTPPTSQTSPTLPNEIDDSTTTPPTTTTPSAPIITCPPTNPGSLKKLMSLFVPASAMPSTTARPGSTVTLPQLFRVAGS